MNLTNSLRIDKSTDKEYGLLIRPKFNIIVVRINIQ